MMEAYKVALLLGLFLCAITCSAKDVSVDCMMAYDEGGAPAVFKSQNCPRWVLPIKSSQNHMDKCQFATLQGRRHYQEDRIVCNPAMKIPILGKEGQKDVNVSVAAVFDGHGGKEASELASKKFLEYFSLHVVFINYNQAFRYKENAVANQQKITAESSNSIVPSEDTSLYAILEEALLRTFKDIDSEFSQKALRKGYTSGSTGTVVLLVNGKVLVGYVGDSKAVLCSRRIHDAEGNMAGSCAEELTRDHHPDREDEKARIEAAGGFVRVWGVPRVNGILAMSRSIGDVTLKRYGVIAEPEIIGWRDLTSYNSYLVVASDGIFESLTTRDVCDILHETCARDATDAGSSSLSSCSASSSSSLAERIVNTAFEWGSMDNLSVIVIPLEPANSSR